MTKGRWMSVQTWCEASGSDDAYRPDDSLDTVECHKCGRWLYLTVALRLPRHLNQDS